MKPYKNAQELANAADLQLAYVRSTRSGVRIWDLRDGETLVSANLSDKQLCNFLRGYLTCQRYRGTRHA